MSSATSASSSIGGALAVGEAFSFHVKYENVMIPMRDGVKLAGDLYLPAVDGVLEEGESRKSSHCRRADFLPPKLSLTSKFALARFLPSPSLRSSLPLRADSHPLQQGCRKPRLAQSRLLLDAKWYAWQTRRASRGEAEEADGTRLAFSFCSLPIVCS